MTFTKTFFIICIVLPKQDISLKPYDIVSSSYIWFSINKYLFEQNLVCWIFNDVFVGIEKLCVWNVYESIAMYMKLKKISK